uniref:3-oxoacyl-[acyl-carrier-protein] reductase n=1 Tax=Tetraselmis chuii TaxID=63592 RepID=A0A7S1SJW2_9CHLO|mmetsp:Transcript_16137/g.28692  ORF Transcript_16137/g.28692 Transcript_16137/m.28692 type:complete len:214 (+) Transcript_16137:1673-2314(+)
MALTSRSVEELDEVARECERAGSPATYVAPCDLSDGAAVERLAQDLVSTFGGVEVLVNNAGILVNGNPLEGDPDEWEHMMDVIVNAPMRLTRRLAPKMAERMSGFVINIGSIAGTEAMSGAAAAYAAAKAGLRGWSRSAYLTLRHKNVKCVLINPGFVNTDMVTSRPALVGQLIPERMIQPSDIADAVSFVLNSSPGCVPEEMNLRLGLSAFK